MLKNRPTAVSATISMKTRPLGARWSDERSPTRAVGTRETAAHSFSTGFESPPDPLTDHVPTERRSPPKSHTDATTTK